MHVGVTVNYNYCCNHVTNKQTRAELEETFETFHWTKIAYFPMTTSSSCRGRRCKGCLWRGKQEFKSSISYTFASITGSIISSTKRPCQWNWTSVSKFYCLYNIDNNTFNIILLHVHVYTCSAINWAHGLYSKLHVNITFVLMIFFVVFLGDIVKWMSEFSTLRGAAKAIANTWRLGVFL